MSFLILIILAIVTIKYLPFINTEAALRFQFWIKSFERKIDDLIDRLESEKKKKEDDNSTK